MRIIDAFGASQIFTHREIFSIINGKLTISFAIFVGIALFGLRDLDRWIPELPCFQDRNAFRLGSIIILEGTSPLLYAHLHSD